MIGFQLLCIERADGSLLCDKVSCWFSTNVEILRRSEGDESVKANALKMYEAFDEGSEFPLTIEEIQEIKKAKTCVEGKEGYHKLACDGILIIPITKDKFLSVTDYVKSKELIS